MLKDENNQSEIINPREKLLLLFEKPDKRARGAHAWIMIQERPTLRRARREDTEI